MFFKRSGLYVSRQQAAEAAHTMGLELDGLTEGAVRKRFLQIATKVHPDRGGEEAAAADSIRAAAEARGLLLTWITALPDDSCTQCRGRGYVFASLMGAVKLCPKCQ